MNRDLAAQLSVGQLNGAVADDLVDIHIRLRAGPGLPDIQREAVVQLAVYDLARHALDQVSQPAWQPPGPAVDVRRGLLHVPVGVVDLLGHAVVTDREVNQGPLRLRTPVPVRRYVDRAHGVGLPAGARCGEANRQVTYPGRGARAVRCHRASPSG